MPDADRGTKSPVGARALAPALLLCGSILVFVGSCGGQGLTFPGSIPAKRRHCSSPPLQRRSGSISVVI